MAVALETERKKLENQTKDIEEMISLLKQLTSGDSLCACRVRQPSWRLR